MKLMIDIPEEDYHFIKKQVANGICITSPLKICIANGTPLPKGHGRLIDVTKVGTSSFKIQEILAKAPTIIEADNAERSDRE